VSVSSDASASSSAGPMFGRNAPPLAANQACSCSSATAWQSQVGSGWWRRQAVHACQHQPQRRRACVRVLKASLPSRRVVPAKSSGCFAGDLLAVSSCAVAVLWVINAVAMRAGLVFSIRGLLCKIEWAVNALCQASESRGESCRCCTTLVQAHGCSEGQPCV
jgi:hypothetical protein